MFEVSFLEHVWGVQGIFVSCMSIVSWDNLHINQSIKEATSYWDKYNKYVMFLIRQLFEVCIIFLYLHDKKHQARSARNGVLQR